MSYRQWLAGMIAGHMLASDGIVEQIGGSILSGEIDADKGMRIWGKSVWLMVDAVLEAENST
jgi:hypothetical protein